MNTPSDNLLQPVSDPTLPPVDPQIAGIAAGLLSQGLLPSGWAYGGLNAPGGSVASPGPTVASTPTSAANPALAGKPAGVQVMTPFAGTGISRTSVALPRLSAQTSMAPMLHAFLTGQAPSVNPNVMGFIQQRFPHLANLVGHLTGQPSTPAVSAPPPPQSVQDVLLHA